MSTPMGRDEVLAVLAENIGTHGEICADSSCNVIARTRQASAAVVALYDDNERMGNETTECAQIVGQAVTGGIAALHVGHLPDMCRVLVARCEALERAVERKDGALRLYCNLGQCPASVREIRQALAYTGTEPSDAEGGG